MGKKDRSYNPTDVLRRQQKKKELKKNKEDRNRSRLVKQTKRFTQREETDLITLNSKDKDGTITTTEKLKLTALLSRWEQVNEARVKLGLAPREIPDKVVESKKPKSEKVYKYYHPTFNPHGIKRSEALAKGKLVQEEELEEVEDDQNFGETDQEEESDEENIQLEDLSWIQIPDGEAPETEGQTYYALRLPELRDINTPAAVFEDDVDESDEGQVDESNALPVEGGESLNPSVPHIMPPPFGIPPPFYPHPNLPMFPPNGMMAPPFPFMPPPPGVIPPPMPGSFPIPPPPPGFVPPGVLPPPPMHPNMIPFPFMPPRPYSNKAPDTSMEQPQSPPKKALPSKPISSSAVTGAVVSAAPQVRDLQKEATKMVPSSLKRKKPPR